MSLRKIGETKEGMQEHAGMRQDMEGDFRHEKMG
jgi:hypothetical protein